GMRGGSGSSRLSRRADSLRRASWFPFGPPRGQRRERVVGPRVFGVTPAEVFPHIEVARAPKAGEVARHLDGPMGRREKVKSQRDATARDTRRVGEAEHLLEA